MLFTPSSSVAIAARATAAKDAAARVESHMVPAVPKEFVHKTEKRNLQGPGEPSATGQASGLGKTTAYDHQDELVPKLSLAGLFLCWPVLKSGVAATSTILELSELYRPLSVKPQLCATTVTKSSDPHLNSSSLQ